MVIKADVQSILERAKRWAEIDLDYGAWFRFENQIGLATQGEYCGIRHAYRSGIGEVLTNLSKALDGPSSGPGPIKHMLEF